MSRVKSKLLMLATNEADWSTVRQACEAARVFLPNLQSFASAIVTRGLASLAHLHRCSHICVTARTLIIFGPSFSTYRTLCHVHGSCKLRQSRSGPYSKMAHAHTSSTGQPRVSKSLCKASDSSHLLFASSEQLAGRSTRVCEAPRGYSKGPLD